MTPAQARDTNGGRVRILRTFAQTVESFGREGIKSVPDQEGRNQNPETGKQPVSASVWTSLGARQWLAGSIANVIRLLRMRRSLFL